MEGLTLNVYLFVLAAAAAAEGNLKWNFIPTRENNNPAGIESRFCFVFCDWPKRFRKSITCEKEPFPLRLCTR